jgi:hypothetical protein
MSNVSEMQPSKVGGSTTTRKLIQAAALASMLVPLGSVIAESATITCVSTAFGSGGCDGVGAYPSGGGETPNIWKFFDDAEEPNLLYTLEIVGASNGSTILLSVSDRQVLQFSETPLFLLGFGAECIPMADEDHCLIFDISVLSSSQDWVNGYYATMTWFGNGDPISTPPENGTNHILKAEDGFNFNQALIETLYDPDPTPVDPALGGRGDSFSSLIGTTGATIPEPATLSLLAIGLGTAFYRRRRQRF